MSIVPCYRLCLLRIFFFFFNDTATTEIYTLSLHDALPICVDFDYRQIEFFRYANNLSGGNTGTRGKRRLERAPDLGRSEEHTSELQSRLHLVCRLLLEKKKKKNCDTRIAHQHAVLQQDAPR